VFRSIGLYGSSDGHDKKLEDKLSKANKDSIKLTTEVIHGLMSQVLKNCLFNGVTSETDQQQQQNAANGVVEKLITE